MTMIESVGWVLLHFVWQGAVIALALAAGLAMTGEAQARLRYALSCGALAMMLIVTVATAGTLIPDAARQPPRAADSTTKSVASAPTSEAVASEILRRSRTEANGTPLAGGAEAGAGASQLARRLLDTGLPWLVGAWGLGVLLLSVRLLGGWWGARALRVVGVSPVPDWCHQQLATLAARMRVARPVTMVSSIRLSVPVIVGHVRPVIVLPAAALAGLSPQQLEAILAHELAHVRRHDYLVNLAQTVIETLLFYHPAVWWVSGQVRVSREHCCDDLAVAACRSRQDYVHALLDLEELRGRSELLAPLALGATDGSLLARGRRLLAPADRAQGDAASPRLAASVIGLTVVVAAIASASLQSAVVPSSVAPPAPVLAGPAENTPVATPGEQTPQREPAAVVVAPDTSAALDSRWAWAERAAQTAGQRRYWIGYSVSPVKTLPPFVFIDRSTKVIADGGSAFSGHLMSRDARGLRFPGRPLAVAAAQNHAMKLLFELETGRGEPTLVSVHGSTLSIPVDTQDRRVFWLGPADAAQSLDRIDRFYRATASLDLKNDLIAATGVHDLSAPVVAWLERRVASQDSDDLRADAAEWIAYHPIAASLQALERIARTDRSSRVRREAAEALGDLAMPEAAPVLIALAQQLTDLDARREAVEALGSRPEREARDALASIARQDASVDIQREAVETLGDFEDRSGVPFLLDLVRSHPTGDVRREAIETLADAMPGDTAVPFLEKLVKEDPDLDVQREALEGLAGIGNPASLEVLKELTRSSSNREVRREAVEALADRASQGGDGDQKTIVELLARLAATDRDADVQAEAAETLGEIGGASAVAELRKLAESDAEERMRVEAIEALGESGASASETAAFLKRLALADRSHAIQSEAIETLEGLAGGAGIAALIDLARDHPVPEARREALERLLESEHPSARAVFDRALGKKR